LSDTGTVAPAVAADEAVAEGGGAQAMAASTPPADFSFEQLEPSPPLPRDASERLLARAIAESERIREQAQVEGYAEGRAAGHEEGLAETTAAALAMGEALRELHELRGQMADELEHDAVELAVALARKVLAGAFEAQPERVLDVVRGALRRVADRRQIVVLVDPQDLEVVSSAVGDRSKLGQQAQAGGIELCDVQADRRVGRGGAVVRTAEGEIDATVETQLQRAQELMLAAGEPPA
jgi:flagellar assembly protein FliH